MTRIVIFAIAVSDRTQLIARLRAITGDPLAQIADAVDSGEPFFDRDMFAADASDTGVRLRRILDEVPDRIATLSIHEVPRMASWRDADVLRRHKIDREILRRILESNLHDSDDT